MPTSLLRTRTGTVSIQPVRLAGSNKVTYVAVPLNSVPPLIRYGFLLFIFTLPFEAQDVGFLTGFLSPARIAGMMFFAVYFAYHIPIFGKRFPAIPVALYGFLGYIAVFVVGGVITGGVFSILVRTLTLVQLFIFVWIASDLLKEKRLAIQALLTYAIALNILASGVIFGLLGARVVAGRTTVLQEDMNGLAIHLGVAVLIAAGLYVSPIFKRLSLRLMIAVLAVLPLIAIAKTGSRGGLAAFVVGLLVLIIPYGRKTWRWRPVLLGILIMFSVGYFVSSNTHFMDRWYESYDQGRFSNRELLFPAAIEMILERPIIGWQRNSWYHSFQLGSWDDADPHNLFLFLLLEVGLLGTIPFLIGLWACVRCAWKSRDGDFGYISLALFVTFLVAGMSLMTLVWKPFWLALAIAVGFAGELDQRSARLVGRLTSNKMVST